MSLNSLKKMPKAPYALSWYCSVMNFNAPFNLQTNLDFSFVIKLFDLLMLTDVPFKFGAHFCRYFAFCRKGMNQLTNVALSADNVSALSNASTAVNSSGEQCPLSALLDQISQNASERKRLTKVNPEWFRIALKTDSQSKSGRFLKAIEKKKERKRRRAEAEASLSVEERHQQRRTAERTALRIETSDATSKRPASLHTTGGAVAAAATTTTKATSSSINYEQLNTIHYHIQPPARTSTVLRRWSRRSALQRYKSRMARRAASTHNSTKALQKSLYPVVRAIAAVLASTRKTFVSRLIAQKLPSSSTVGVGTTPKDSIGPSTSAIVSLPLAQRIANRCLPLIGATVSVLKRSTAKKLSNAAPARSFRRKGIVLHQTARKVVVALIASNRKAEGSGSTNQETGAQHPLQCTGKMIAVSKACIKVLY